MALEENLTTTDAQADLTAEEVEMLNQMMVQNTDMDMNT